MTAQSPTSHPNRRLTGIAATLGVHVALVCLWQFSGRIPDASQQARKAIQWIDIAPRPPRAAAAQDDKPSPVAAAPLKKRARIDAAEPPPALAEPQSAAITLPTPEAPAGKSSYDILQQARRDLGKIDKDLKKEFKGPLIKKPADSPQIRLVRGMEDAYDAASPKWYEAPKAKEVIDPGGYGRKRYRVTTAFGTYCVTQESDRSPGAQLDVGKRVEPKITNCPKYEQPATEQQW